MYSEFQPFLDLSAVSLLESVFPERTKIWYCVILKKFQGDDFSLLFLRVGVEVFVPLGVLVIIVDHISLLGHICQVVV